MNLRDMIDGRTLEAATPPPPMKPGQDEGEDTPQTGSPGAQHVAQHVQDPFGTTKADLDELNQKRMEYEMKKAEMDMKLAPVESVTRGIRDMHDMHPLDPNNPLGNPDANQGYTDPNNPMAGVPGGTQMKPPGMVPPGGPPPNMGGSPGQPAQPPMGKPAMGGMVPGAAPKIGVPGQPQGPASSVPPMPPKMGMPQPGQGNGVPPIGGQPGMPGKKPSAPGGWKPAGEMGPKPAPMPNPQQMQYNPQAQPPNGQGSLPGAKGPGESKPAGKKKADGSKKSGSNSSGGKVAIHVNADSVSPSPAKMTQSSYIGSNSLRSCNDYKKMEAHAEGCDCEACQKKMKAYGTSEGVRKEWDTRGRTGKTKKDDGWFPGPAGQGRDVEESKKSSGKKDKWFPGPAGWANDMKGGVVKAVAPPGREAQVKKLKKKFGKKSAFKIAWSQFEK